MSRAGELWRDRAYWRRELAAAEAAAKVGKEIGGGVYWREQQRLRVERARERLAQVEDFLARSTSAFSHYRS